MKHTKLTLYKQLLAIILIIVAIIFIILALILPSRLLPIYEDNMYQTLKRALIVSRNDINNADKTEIAYLYVYNSVIYVSSNITDIIDLDTRDIVSLIQDEYGKFRYKNKTYC